MPVWIQTAFSLYAGQLHQHIVNGIRVFALTDKRVFQVYEGFDNLRPFLLGQIDVILLFFHCPAPPDASIILRQLQKTQRCDYTIYTDSNKAPTLPVEALLLPLRMPLFCSFEIIALVGCGITRFAFF